MYLIRALIGRDNDKIVKVYYRISMIKKLFSSIYLLIVTIFSILCITVIIIKLVYVN